MRCLCVLLFKNKRFKTSACSHDPVTDTWYRTCPPPGKSSELIAPGCETWSLGKSCGDTHDYISFPPEDGFLTEGTDCVPAVIGVALSWGGRDESLGHIKWLEYTYTEQGSRGEWGKQGQVFNQFQRIFLQVLGRIGLHINRPIYSTRLITK